MAKRATVKIGPENDKKLYVRPGAMAHFRRSTDKNRKLHELLAKNKN